MSCISIIGVLALTIPSTMPDDIAECLRLDPSILGSFRIDRSDKNEAGWGQRYIDGTRVLDTSALLPISTKFEAEWFEVTTPSAYVENPRTVPWSGLPLGDRCRVNGIKLSSWIFASSGTVIVAAHLRSLEYDGPSVELQEGAARYALAKLAGLATSPAGTLKIGSIDVPGCRKDRDGRPFAPLDGWASAAGVRLTFNKRLGTVAFEHKGSDWVVPLGSPKVKRGSEWHAGGSVCFWHGGRWFVPVSALEAKT